MGKEQLPPWKVHVWSLSVLSMQGQHSVKYQIAREYSVPSRVHVCFIGCFIFTSSLAGSYWAMPQVPITVSKHLWCFSSQGTSKTLVSVIYP